MCRPKFYDIKRRFWMMVEVAICLSSAYHLSEGNKTKSANNQKFLLLIRMCFYLISFTKPDVRKTLKINFSGFEITS